MTIFKQIMRGLFETIGLVGLFALLVSTAFMAMCWIDGVFLVVGLKVLPAAALSVAAGALGALFFRGAE